MIIPSIILSDHKSNITCKVYLQSYQTWQRCTLESVLLWHILIKMTQELHPLRLPTTVHSIEGLQLTTVNGDERQHWHKEGFQPQLQTDATKATSWNADENKGQRCKVVQHSDSRCSKLTWWLHINCADEWTFKICEYCIFPVTFLMSVML